MLADQRQQQRELRKAVKPFEQHQMKTSIFQLFNTLVPFILLWFLAYKALAISPFLTVAIAVIASGFVIRIFIIFHDCTHYSFFRNNKLNRGVGTVLGIVTLFPFSKWQREHSIHHATSSNLDKRGTGDVWVMTVNEYVEATPWMRLVYRIYRHPIVLFGFGPFYLYLVANRMNRKDARLKERLNTYLTNASIVIIYAGLIFLVGIKAFLLIQLPILFIAGSLGIWLFYVQHQFEDSYFEEENKWSFVKAAVDGSSYYKLPAVLQWVTGNIGYHHVHHLSPNVPNYRLAEAHENTPPLHQATTITLKTSLKSIKFRLFDEKKKDFVTFKDVKPLIKAKEKAEANSRQVS
ncbi:MAG TPA: fatty acid desaturase [Pseudogracilibacillus sp.]|nr:fatty acid desaturase [Pseudogracilibacillus sp.]